MRGNFLITLLGSACFFYLHVISFNLLISKFDFLGWETGNLWVMMYTFEIFTYLAFYFFWKGLQKTPQEIGTGAFDIILAKPFNTRFVALFRNGSLHNLICALLGVCYLVYTLRYYHVPTTSLSVVVYVLSLAVSLWIFHCLSVLFICLNFKNGYVPGTSTAPFEIQEVFKYPASVFEQSGLLLRILIIPFALLVTVPTASLISKPLSPSLLSTYLLTFVVLTLWSGWTWKSSLRHYSSASS